MDPKYVDISISLETLDLYVSNPRFDPVFDQRSALHAICTDQGTKLVELAEDVVHSGLSPIDRPLILKIDGQDRYTVLEGNRRITALKLLAQPTRIEDTPLADPLKKRLKRLAETFDSKTHDQIQCSLAASMEDAKHWIELRHTGQNKGAGVVDWDGVSTARFRGDSPGYNALEFVRYQLKGKFDPEVLDRFPVTNLERLLGDPAFRKLMGLEMKGRQLTSFLDPDTTAENLYSVMKDLQQPDVTVGHVYTKDDRKVYLAKIKPQLKTGTAKKDGWKVEGNSSEPLLVKPAAGPRKATLSKKGSLPSSKKRNHLIPRSTTFPVDSTKANDIYLELRKLDVRLYPVSVTVLARVFLEISCDLYVKKHKLQKALQAEVGSQREPTLRHKIACVKKDLIQNGADKSTINAAITVFNSIGSPFSIEQLHMVVHNPNFHPDAPGLIRAWDTCEGFFLALWERM